MPWCWIPSGWKIAVDNGSFFPGRREGRNGADGSEKTSRMPFQLQSGERYDPEQTRVRPPMIRKVRSGVIGEGSWGCP